MKKAVEHACFVFPEKKWSSSVNVCFLGVMFVLFLLFFTLVLSIETYTPILLEVIFIGVLLIKHVGNHNITQNHEIKPHIIGRFAVTRL